MENTSKNPGKDGDGDDGNAVLYGIESLESKGETVVSKKCKRNREPGRPLLLSVRRSRASANRRELFLHNIHGSYNTIPKHLTTCDEKYVLRCLEAIRNCALRAAAWNFSQKVDFFSDHTSSLAEIKNRSSNNMAIEYPLGGQTEVVMNSSGDWGLGTISGSPTMVRILKSPLLQQFGSLDGQLNYGKTGLFGVSEAFYTDFTGSVQESIRTLSHKQQRDLKVLDSKYVSAPLHTRDASISSSNSSFSDQSSSSSHGVSFQGMLQCTWKNGRPRHVFTVDDKKEVYIANLTEADSSHDKDLDYVYTFHLRRNGKKDTDLELETVAKMRVSTSITFTSTNSEIRESQFVLSVSNDNRTGETQTPNQAQKKNRRLTRKVTDVFRPSHYHRQRSSSTLEVSAGAVQDTALDQSEDAHNHFHDLDESCADASNHELAAIVVKDISNSPKEVELGGWGLKFLKKAGKTSSPGTMAPSEHSRNTGECSTSMDIVIPAGFHGGPRTRVGGPSSLIERWISGGLCDCGGWDIGCPLTILNTRSSSSSTDSGECKSIDLFTQGAKQNGPTMKMVNIHNGLYYIHFQSTLSTLQSFAIAAAVIHSRSPALRSKVYRS